MAGCLSSATSVLRSRIVSSAVARTHASRNLPITTLSAEGCSMRMKETQRSDRYQAVMLYPYIKNMSKNRCSNSCPCGFGTAGSCSVMDEREIMSIISRAILQMYLLRQAGRDLVFVSKPESRERAVAVAVLWGGEVAGRAFPKGRSDGAPPSTTTTESLTSPRLKPRHKNSAIIWKY
ncbi:hypothetical protein IG631_16348 [Alternaria alternata]|nr:hypothetical protein IG631_16348 [Alternaria alternata]